MSLLLISGIAYAQGKIQVQSRSFRSGSEPNGFRDIKWGTNVSSTKGMEFLRRDWGFNLPVPEGMKADAVYRRKSDLLVIGKAKLRKIEYFFWGGQFYRVSIDFIGDENWINLRHELFELFGEMPIGDFTYGWMGQITGIVLSYEKAKRTGWVMMVSQQLNEQRQLYLKEWGKEKRLREKVLDDGARQR